MNFYSRLARRGLLAPEADELVGAETHEFPAHEEVQEVVRQHQHEHGEREHLQPREEERVLGIALHVGRAEHVHEEADQRDHDEGCLGFHQLR